MIQVSSWIVRINARFVLQGERKGHRYSYADCGKASVTVPKIIESAENFEHFRIVVHWDRLGKIHSLKVGKRSAPEKLPMAETSGWRAEIGQERAYGVHTQCIR